MKATIFLLMLFKLGCLSAQFQLPFPNDPFNLADFRVWTQYRYTPPDVANPNGTAIEYEYQYVQYSHDSIEGELYNRLYDQDISLPLAHYRVDSLKVYYRTDYAAGSSSPVQLGRNDVVSGEYLLYDFGIDIGDTFELTATKSIILSHFDSINIEGVYYKTFHFYEAPSMWYWLPLNYYWIEGIGSSIGFYPYFSFFEDFLEFKCFWANNTYYFTNGVNCHDANASVEENSPLFVFHPNPATDQIEIENINNTLLHVRLANSMGQLIQEFKFTESVYKIDVSSLPKGVYHLKINDKHEKVIIQ